MKPEFMDRIAKIIEEVHTRTCMDKIDTEVLEDILQEELYEYYNEVLTYGHNLEEAVDSAYEVGYSLGYDDGQFDGYSAGYSDGYYEGRESGLEGAVATEEAQSGTSAATQP